MSQNPLKLNFFVSVLTFIFSFAIFAESPKEVIIALKPDKNPEQMQSERAQLEKVLSENLGTKVKVIIPISSAVILQGFANGTIDLGYLSSLDMVNAEKIKAADVLLAGEINGKTSYESYWLTKKVNKAKTIKDLKKKPVAFASRTSTSGYLIPFWDLIQSGELKPKESVEKYFSSVFYGTGYVSAIQKVLDGTVEAAAVSDYVFLGDKHLSVEEKSQLRILDTQGPVPTHVIAVRSTMDRKIQSQLRTALLKLNDSHQPLRDKVFTSKLVEVDSQKHLSTTREALVKTGLEIDTK